MVAELWLLKLGSQVSVNLKHALLLETSNKSSTKKQEPKETIGILSFEVANLMSTTVYLHKSLADKEIFKLRDELENSRGIKTLVSCDESYLMELALSEKLEELNRVAQVVSRLGKKCSLPALQGFEHVYGDVVSGVVDVKELGFLVKDMEVMVRRMERFVNLTSALYDNMMVLSELEQTTKKFQQSHLKETRKAFEQKLMRQEQNIKHLQSVSLWNQTYDKVVELLARTVCTLYARICNVLVTESGSQNRSLNHLKGNGGAKTCQIDTKLENSGVMRRGTGRKNGDDKSGLNEKYLMEKGKLNVRPKVEAQPDDVQEFQPEYLDFLCGKGPGRLLKDCLSFSSSVSKVDDDAEDKGHDVRIKHLGCRSTVIGDQRSNLHHSGSVASSQISIFTFRNASSSRSSPKSRLMTYASPSTIGGSALALHYANVIISIEKLLMYPHLVSEEARDDLYSMLPKNLKVCMKSSLKSRKKDLARYDYDGALAHDLKNRVDEILKWLSPLAHNMIVWQNERNIEQQQMVKRANVLLLQTLFFADRAKTEDVICQLLIGANYICRYEYHLDCSSSVDFNDCAGELQPPLPY